MPLNFAKLFSKKKVRSGTQPRTPPALPLAPTPVSRPLTPVTLAHSNARTPKATPETPQRATTPPVAKPEAHGRPETAGARADTPGRKSPPGEAKPRRPSQTSSSTGDSEVKLDYMGRKLLRGPEVPNCDFLVPDYIEFIELYVMPINIFYQYVKNFLINDTMLDLLVYSLPTFTRDFNMTDQIKAADKLLPQEALLTLEKSDKYELVRRTGRRSYIGKSKAHQVAHIKMEGLGRNKNGPTIYREVKFYATLLADKTRSSKFRSHFLQVLSSGTLPGRYHYLITAPADCDLLEMRRRVGGRFSKPTYVQICAQTLQAIHDVHLYHHMLRNVSPRNFLVGLGSSHRIIFLCNFECAYEYTQRTVRRRKAEKRPDETPPYFENPFQFDTSYSPRAIHRHADYRRVDDIEGWMLMCVDLWDEEILGLEKGGAERTIYYIKTLLMAGGLLTGSEIEPYFAPAIREIDSYDAYKTDFVDFTFYGSLVEQMAKDWNVSGKEILDWIPDPQTPLRNKIVFSRVKGPDGKNEVLDKFTPVAQAPQDVSTVERAMPSRDAVSFLQRRYSKKATKFEPESSTAGNDAKGKTVADTNNNAMGYVSERVKIKTSPNAKLSPNGKQSSKPAAEAGTSKPKTSKADRKTAPTSTGSSDVANESKTSSDDEKLPEGKDKPSPPAADQN